jgi:hypothetical protein
MVMVLPQCMQNLFGKLPNVSLPSPRMSPLVAVMTAVPLTSPDLIDVLTVCTFGGIFIGLAILPSVDFRSIVLSSRGAM